MSKRTALNRLGKKLSSILSRRIEPVERYKRSKQVPIQTEEYEDLLRDAAKKYGVNTISPRYDTALAALIVFWKTNKRPPSSREWGRAADIPPGRSLYVHVKRLLNEGKIIRINKGEWAGRYIPTE